MLKVSVVGATGYAGEELVKILLRHKGVKITSLYAKIDKQEKFAKLFPAFNKKIDLDCKPPDTDELINSADLVFLALPHRSSFSVAPQILKAGKKVIDLSADYRLHDVKAYEKAYGAEHIDKENIKLAVYGLCEFYRDKIKGAKLIANPGCYPTSVILGAAPLLKEGIVEFDCIISDSKSGITGAGRAANAALNFGEVNENIKPYKVNAHQHMPEINQELTQLAKKDISINFVPYQLPMDRGILSTIYFRPKRTLDTKTVLDLYNKFYKDEPFIRVLPEGVFPHTKAVAGTNFCDIGVKADKDLIIVFSAIDNLVKGASGQAVQNMNIMFGFQETEGLM